MRSCKKILVVGALVLGLMAFQATPASAATTGAIAFQGTATVAPGLSSPVGLPPCTPLCPNGANGSWAFNIGLGIGLARGTHAAGPGTVTATVGGAGAYLGAGSITGLGAYCGASSGGGGGGSMNINGRTWTLQNVGWEQSVATIIPFHGWASLPTPSPTEHGVILGLAIALPTTGSCLAGTATGFTVVGAAVVSTS